MNKENYFKQLIQLYEAEGMAGTEEVVPQENIADTGSDVNPQPVQEEAPVEDNQEEMMAQEIPQENDIPLDNNLIMEKQKFVKLFESMEDLVDYGETFIESIKCVDINLLDLETYKRMKVYTRDIENLVEKVKNYLINVFNSDSYERVYYAYILFRTEMITCIKGLRKVLKLDEVEDEEKNKKNIEQ